jgi:hypothetical protein
MAVSLYVNHSVVMGLPPKYKIPRAGKRIPWRLYFQHLLETFKAFRGHGITPPNTKASKEVRTPLGGFVSSTFWKPCLINSVKALGCEFV